MKNQRPAIFLLLIIISLVCLALVVGADINYSLSVGTGSGGNYQNGQTIYISGSVSPAPPSGGSVSITVTSPSGSQVFSTSTSLNGAGGFSTSFTSGGSGWTTGGYTIHASWGSVTGTSSFQWGGQNQIQNTVSTTSTSTVVVGQFTTYQSTTTATSTSSMSTTSIQAAQMNISASDTYDPYGRWWNVYINNLPASYKGQGLYDVASSYTTIRTHTGSVSFNYPLTTNTTIYFVITQSNGPAYGNYSGGITANGGFVTNFKGVDCADALRLRMNGTHLLSSKIIKLQCGSSSGVATQQAQQKAGIVRLISLSSYNITLYPNSNATLYATVQWLGANLSVNANNLFFNGTTVSQLGSPTFANNATSYAFIISALGYASPGNYSLGFSTANSISKQVNYTYAAVFVKSAPLGIISAIINFFRGLFGLK